MATIGNTNLTLLDHAKRIEDGKIAKIVEMMTKKNEILIDMVNIPGNTQTGHKTTIRTGLPAVAWRQINKGVQPSKSSTKQIEFAAGMLEGLGQVDEELIALADDGPGLRLSENAPYIEAMSQTLANTLIYGNSLTNPERFTGLAYYYSSLNASVESSANVIDGGGTGSVNTSLYLVEWGENTVHGFFPKNTKAGIDHQDLGKMLIDDGTGTNSKFMAFIDQYKAKLGLALRDWRFVSRICNLDIVALATAGETSDTSANLINMMIKAVNKIPDLQSGRAAWYCNKEVKTALDIKAMNKANAQLTIQNLEDGTFVTRFLGIPIRRVDAILNTESRIVA